MPHNVTIVLEDWENKTTVTRECTAEKYFAMINSPTVSVGTKDHRVTSLKGMNDYILDDSNWVML